MTGPAKKPDTRYECTICEKPYIKQGCLNNHMKKIHKMINPQGEKGFLDSTTYSELDRDETILRTIGQILTAEEFSKDTSDNEEDVFEDTTEMFQDSDNQDVQETSPSEMTVNKTINNPNATKIVEELNNSAPVPLCPRANQYIIQRGKTLPASFLETLLPPPSFLEQLNQSISEQDDPTQVSTALRRFEEEIKVHKCETCDFTCLGSNRLKCTCKKSTA